MPNNNRTKHLKKAATAISDTNNWEKSLNWAVDNWALLVGILVLVVAARIAARVAHFVLDTLREVAQLVQRLALGIVELICLPFRILRWVASLFEEKEPQRQHFQSPPQQGEASYHNLPPYQEQQGLPTRRYIIEEPYDRNLPPRNWRNQRHIPADPAPREEPQTQEDDDDSWLWRTSR